MAAGFVYILSNASIPNQVKIGFTTRSSEGRAKEISQATGVPTAFAVEYEECVGQCEQAEREIHTYLDKYRTNHKREFFAVPLKEAIQVVSSVAARYPPSTADYHLLPEAQWIGALKLLLPASLIAVGIILLLVFGGPIIEAVQSARQGLDQQQSPPQHSQTDQEQERKEETPHPVPPPRKGEH